MSQPFRHTLRVLTDDDGVVGVRWAIGGALLLFGWIGWALLAPVPRYATTSMARVEADGAAHPVQSLSVGRVMSVDVTLGVIVAAGDRILALDDREPGLEAAGAVAQRAALDAELQALDARLVARRAAQISERAAGKASIDEAAARQDDAQRAEARVLTEVELTRRLAAAGAVPPDEVARLEATHARARAQTAEARAALTGAKLRAVAADAQNSSEIASLEGDRAALSARLDAASTELAQAERVREERVLLAPVGGRVAWLAPLVPGAVVAAGDTVATLVPEGPVRVIADFLPGDALGRVSPGQRGRIRLDGFPWASFGAPTVEVVNVASDVRFGRIRVELSVDPQSAPGIPLSHGLPGVLEVQIGEVTPAGLLLDGLGAALTAPTRP